MPEASTTFSGAPFIRPKQSVALGGAHRRRTRAVRLRFHSAPSGSQRTPRAKRKLNEKQKPTAYLLRKAI